MKELGGLPGSLPELLLPLLGLRNIGMQHRRTGRETKVRDGLSTGAPGAPRKSRDALNAPFARHRPVACAEVGRVAGS